MRQTGLIVILAQMVCDSINQSICIHVHVYVHTCTLLTVCMSLPLHHPSLSIG